MDPSSQPRSPPKKKDERRDRRILRNESGDSQDERNGASSSKRRDEYRRARGTSSADSPDARSSEQMQKKRGDYQESDTDDDSDDPHYATISLQLSEKDQRKDRSWIVGLSRPESGPSEQRPEDQNKTKLRVQENSPVRQVADLTPLNCQPDEPNNLSCGQTENVAQSDRVEKSENTGEGVSVVCTPKNRDESREPSQDSFVEDVGAILKDLFRAEPTGEQHGQQSDASRFHSEADIDDVLKTIQLNVEDYDKKKEVIRPFVVSRGDNKKNYKDWITVKNLVASSTYHFKKLSDQYKSVVAAKNTSVEEKCNLGKALQHKKEQKEQIANKLKKLEIEHEKVLDELSQHKDLIATLKQEARHVAEKAEERKNQLKRDLEDADQTVDRLRQQRNQHREENERLRRERNQLRKDCDKWAPTFDRPMNIILPEDTQGNDLIHQLLKDLGEFVPVYKHYKNLRKLKPRDPGTIVVPCVGESQSSVERDIRATLKDLSLGTCVQVVLLLFRCVTPEKGRSESSPSRTNMTDIYNSYPVCMQVIEAYFWNDDFYDCRVNREAVDTLLNICQAHVLLGR